MRDPRPATITIAPSAAAAGGSSPAEMLSQRFKSNTQNFGASQRVAPSASSASAASASGGTRNNWQSSVRHQSKLRQATSKIESILAKHGKLFAFGVRIQVLTLALLMPGVTLQSSASAHIAIQEDQKDQMLVREIEGLMHRRQKITTMVAVCTVFMGVGTLPAISVLVFVFIFVCVFLLSSFLLVFLFLVLFSLAVSQTQAQICSSSFCSSITFCSLICPADLMLWPGRNQ